MRAAYGRLSEITGVAVGTVRQCVCFAANIAIDVIRQWETGIWSVGVAIAAVHGEQAGSGVPHGPNATRVALRESGPNFTDQNRLAGAIGDTAKRNRSVR